MDNIIQFIDLVDTLPSLNMCFRYSDGRSIISDNPNFISWANDLKSVLNKLKSSNHELEPMISRIVGTIDRMHGWDDANDFLLISTLCQKIRVELENTENSYVNEPSATHNKVFIVHGREMNMRDDVELFIRRLGITPIILANLPNQGKTIFEKLEDNSDVSFAIILYTSCDEGRLKGDKDLKSRARQNVIFEHGFFSAKLGRKNVVALHEEGVEIPSDLSGILYIPLDGAWRENLKKELKAANFIADWTVT